MKKILIALDYNPAAEKVAETGYAIAKSMEAQVNIAHVITEAAWYAMDYSPIMGYQGGYTAGTNEVMQDIKKEAENFLAATANHLGDKTIITTILDGNTTDAIIKHSIEWNADLIVLGSHSPHSLDRLFGTDVANYIVKHSTIPVLIVPTNNK
jgi:nucleotide-binding universal stress UspA family protein